MNIGYQHRACSCASLKPLPWPAMVIWVVPASARPTQTLAAAGAHTSTAPNPRQRNRLQAGCSGSPEAPKGNNPPTCPCPLAGLPHQDISAGISSMGTINFSFLPGNKSRPKTKCNLTFFPGFFSSIKCFIPYGNIFLKKNWLSYNVYL